MANPNLKMVAYDGTVRQGEVTIGYNSEKIQEAREEIANSYTELCSNLDVAREDMIKAIRDCWFGNDCELYIQTVNKKLDDQYDAVKEFFNTISNEETGLLATVENEWKGFQDSVSFE